MMYQSLLSQIESARKNAAVFYKVDLHVHTYESEGDFPKLSDKQGGIKTLTEDDKNPTPEHFIKAGKKAKLRVMAITDHNRSKVAEQIAKLSDNGLLVLPGMEVSIKSHIFPESVVHILAIFPENYSSSDIDKIFGNGTMPIYSERNSDSVLQMSVADLITAVRKNKGICIASHINSNKGLRTLFRESNVKLLRAENRKRYLQLLKERNVITNKEEEELQRLQEKCHELSDETQNQLLLFIAENNFDAIEIQTSDHRQYYSGSHVDDLGIRQIACLINSDAHNLEDIGQIGFSTYIKMTNPSFKDLQKALRDPGTRVRFECEIHQPIIARILGLKFDGSFFQQHIIGFSDNLSCLIGGRGSGKSATIEALRYIFECTPPSSDIDKQKDIKGRLEYTLHDTEIKVLFSDALGDTYVLKRRFGETHTDCYDIQGNLHSEINVAVASNFRIKIYGWGEIEELAKNKRDQLNLLDGFIEHIDETKNLVVDCMQELKSNTSVIVGLASEIKILLPRVIELATKRDLLNKLTSPELNDIFSSYDRNQKGQEGISSLHSLIIEQKKKLVQQDGTAYQFIEEIEKGLTENINKLKDYDWFDDINQKTKNSAKIIQRDYETLLVSIEKLISFLDTKKGILSIEVNQIEKDLNRLAENLESSDMRSALSKRKTLSDEVNELQIIQNQINQKNQSLNDLLVERRDRIIPSLNSARQKITELRKAKLEEINTQLQGLTNSAKVSISLSHQEERKEFLLGLGTGSANKKDPDGILKGVSKHYVADRYAENYSKKHTPHSFVNAILNPSDGYNELQVWSTLEDGSKKEIINQERATAVWKYLWPGNDENQYFDPDKLKKLLELEHCDTEDLVQISLDDRAIEELSPGQRCSALIPIILLESHVPLIIDQPEDNLDNKLVFNLVVDIIRGLKERRQIIMATHNPNIPVSGDAEQIIVFDTQSKEVCETIISGSIDCDEVIENVKAIMEGSEEAFRIRAEKYGYEIPNLNVKISRW